MRLEGISHIRTHRTEMAADNKTKHNRVAQVCVALQRSVKRPSANSYLGLRTSPRLRGQWVSLGAHLFAGRPRAAGTRRPLRAICYRPPARPPTPRTRVLEGRRRPPPLRPPESAIIAIKSLNKHITNLACAVSMVTARAPTQCFVLKPGVRVALKIPVRHETAGQFRVSQDRSQLPRSDVRWQRPKNSHDFHVGGAEDQGCTICLVGTPRGPSRSTTSFTR
jgi:hypothetical protein